MHSYRGVLLSDLPKGRTFSFESSRFYFRLPYTYYVVAYRQYGGLFQGYSHMHAFGSVEPITSVDDKVFGLPIPNTHFNGAACTAFSGSSDDEVTIIKMQLDQFFRGRGCKRFVEPDVLKLVGATPYSSDLTIFGSIAKRTPAIWSEIKPTVKISSIFTPDEE